MINWAKPILIGGVANETFKLAGTLNDSQLVVITDSLGTQSLFAVDKDGSSFLLNCGSSMPPRGPRFENEPEPPPAPGLIYLVRYADGRVAGAVRGMARRPVRRAEPRAPRPKIPS